MISQERNPTKVEVYKVYDLIKGKQGAKTVPSQDKADNIQEVMQMMP